MIVRSLQYRIVIVFVGLLLLVMAIVLALVTRTNGRIVFAEMERELSAGTQVFTRLIEQNQRQLETAATVLSADFAFREAIATQDRPTMRSVIRNHGLRIGAQAMMVISPDGQLIADTQSNSAELRLFPFPDLLLVAESAGKSTGFRQMKDGRLYQIVLVPILAPKRIAWVAMGFLVDDRWAQELSGMNGLAISVIRRSGTSVAVLASSLDGPKRSALPGALTRLSNDLSQAVPIGDEHYQTVQLPLGKELSVVLQRSIEQAEAPFRSLQMALWTIVLAGVVIFSIGSVMLARRIVSPVNELAAAARRIEAGNYIEPVPSLPPDEIGQLAMSFDRMREQVASREQKILKLAYEDTLTGLPNRTRFLEAFNQLPADCPCAIAVLNLDRFAMINNALGHPIGDRLLREVGLRLGLVMPGSVIVARLWADEFAFLLEGADQASAMSIAESVLVKLRDPITLDGQRLDVGGSIGIALYPGDGQDAPTLIRRAEFAMNAAKRRHVGVAFASGIGEETQHEHLSLIGEMREALARQEFLVYYQPKLDLASRKITGAEALIRWQHPEQGLVPPIGFIPFAEQTGFIREITPWLLETVAAQTAQWSEEGLSIVPSINLSTLDLLNTGLVDQMRGLIELHSLPANGLCLEITESALMEDPALALAHLGELAALGFKLSIDDYGTGQASLAYLKTLPVHELKIDQTFILSVADSPKNAAIVRSTIALCHALGLTVVAEGVETSADLAWLADNECDIAQGYGIARPMPADDLPDWIAAYSVPAFAT
ncbi:phosphodiesterase [Sulfuricella sp. T08]|uniref:putative bifunctional diguanylate cyclase/phosphodiesterase n=1 Tax=Sulfuricella sp. T08 TaxID=1632857 RepID=UPI00061798D7|nr:EAL domain-containing protein [Sulfuricella sp. T08]GAO35018.1 phosphodiesterase [Sulfuricella sp. T08]